MKKNSRGGDSRVSGHPFQPIPLSREGWFGGVSMLFSSIFSHFHTFFPFLLFPYTEKGKVIVQDGRDRDGRA